MRAQVDNSTYNNDWFKKEIGASRLKQVMWYFVNALFFRNSLNPSSGINNRLLRLFGARIGKGVVFKPGINIKYPWKLNIGDYTWVGENVWIDNLADVTIGKSVCLSQGAVLQTGNHDYTRESFDLIIKKIVLEDGVWIGTGAIVCPGVTGCSHAVLTAGSIAVRQLEPYTIYQGNPAMPVRERIIK